MPKVIAGVSRSLSGLAALRYAVAEARRRRQPLWAVRAWQLNSGGTRWRAAFDGEQSLAEASRHEIAEAFEAAVGAIPQDIDIAVRVPSGLPAQTLLDCASPDDLLVIGAASRRFLGGGPVRGCTRGAPCPVVVVPPPALAAALPRRVLRAALR